LSDARRVRTRRGGKQSSRDDEEGDATEGGKRGARCGGGSVGGHVFAYIIFNTRRGGWRRLGRYPIPTSIESPLRRACTARPLAPWHPRARADRAGKAAAAGCIFLQSSLRSLSGAGCAGSHQSL